MAERESVACVHCCSLNSLILAFLYRLGCQFFWRIFWRIIQSFTEVALTDTYQLCSEGINIHACRNSLIFCLFLSLVNFCIGAYY